jgi:hypothetical protein
MAKGSENPRSKLKSSNEVCRINWEGERGNALAPYTKVQAGEGHRRLRRLGSIPHIIIIKLLELRSYFRHGPCKV